MVKVNKVSKYFGKEKAVNGLSFELKKGEITGLLGPNGAGKSTTMRMITSYLLPSAGEIFINGLDTQKNTLETQKLIGYIPENNPLYTEMLVYDYLEMSARFFDPALAEPSRIKQTAKSVGLSDKLMTPIHELSKGYKQRVALAAALAHNPPVLIMDEPTEGLDPNQRHEIHRLIKSLSKDKAILISSHVLQEVKAMCSNVVVINNGRLVASGSLDSLSGYKTIKMQIEGSRIKDELSKLIKKDEKLKIADEKSKIKEVKISTKKEIRPEISALSAKNNWIIWEMQIEDSLEEIFEELK